MHIWFKQIEKLQRETDYACKQKRNLTKDSEIEGPQQIKWPLTYAVYFNYIAFFPPHMKLKK